MYFALKTLISAFLITVVTELAGRMPVGAALIKSLPLTSLLVFLIMKYEGKTEQQIGAMSWDILWMVIPSLILFALFPLLLGRGWGFGMSLVASVAVMALGYLGMFRALT